jgi:cyclopropane fatty-acyl-phospholipid synthase-like methyltransferase
MLGPGDLVIDIGSGDGCAALSLAAATGCGVIGALCYHSNTSLLYLLHVLIL